MAERFETTIQLEGKTRRSSEAKREETRRRRIEKTLARLRADGPRRFGGIPLVVGVRWSFRNEDAVFGASSAARRHRLYFAKPSY